MKNLLIHIGYHKTGTTWLQQELFISENAFFEPLSLRNKGHSSLADHFIYDGDKYLLSPFKYNEKKITQELEKIIDNNSRLQFKIPVMSHERLSGNPHSAGFDAKTIALRLHRIFPNARILIVIREQKSFILSNYFQYLSIGGTDGIEKYLNVKYDGKRPFFSPNHINYLPLITEYYKLFGKEHVLVLPFEMFKSEPMLFFKKMGEFLKIELAIEEDKLMISHNMKEHFYINYYLRFLNIFSHKSSVNNYSGLSNKYTKKITASFIAALVRLTSSQSDKRIIEKFRKIIVDFVNNRYIESNKEISQLIGIDLSTYTYQ